MRPRRWPNNRLQDSHALDHGPVAAVIVEIVRWLVTILLTSWGYLE
ncbi:hypothetical protein ACFQ1L_09510 [Phytohabitans flavus]|nr:hypothetical protein [Phytohabitans flavus]